MTVNMHEAKTNLSKLIRLVEEGDEVVIARDGKPVARLSRVEPAGKRKLPYGIFTGKLKMLSGFDDPIEEFDNPL